MNGQESDGFVVVGGRESRPQGEGNHKTTKSEAERRAGGLETDRAVSSEKKASCTQLQEIAKKAKENPKHRFNGVYRLLNSEFLRECWGEMNLKSASGVDGVSPKEFSKDLDQNIQLLTEALEGKRYRAPRIRRKNIPKGDGKMRPLGIPTTGDKLVQKGVSKILEAIYERDFLDCSYGYRKGIPIEKAIEEVDRAIFFEGYEWVLEADIRGYFEHIDHQWLIRMLRERIADEQMIHLIGKWLKAGIMEESGEITSPEAGTPQGGTVSPILANVYLHYVLDLWMEKRMKKRLKGRAQLFRYADDFVILFEKEEDARGMMPALEERLHAFGLELSPQKTRILKVDRKKREGWFDFLGFTFRWGLGRKGQTILQRVTSKKKLGQSLNRFKQWCMESRSLTNAKIASRVRSILTGYRNYYGLVGNTKRVSSYFHSCQKILFRWLNRRSQRKSMDWDRFNRWWRHHGLDRIKPGKPPRKETVWDLIEKLSTEASGMRSPVR